MQSIRAAEAAGIAGLADSVSVHVEARVADTVLSVEEGIGSAAETGVGRVGRAGVTLVVTGDTLTVAVEGESVLALADSVDW